MSKKNDVWGSCSQDYDSLLFGTPKLVRNLTISGRRKLPRKNVYVEVKPELIELETSLKELDINQNELIDLAILLGTDFNPDGIGIKGIGPKTAYKLIKEHKSLEEILKLPKMKEAEINFDIENIRDIFLNPPIKTDYKLDWLLPDIDKIVEFLSEERGFSETRVRNALEKVIKTIEDQKKQPTLDSFFGG
jgi:flap endonuclease-1